jgi:hypothetical protein
MPNTGNEDIISGTEKKIIQRSVFVENYHNVAKIINYRDIDLLPAINIYNGVVRENRMLTVRRALEKISGSKGFFNNVEYFREMAVYGHHYYDKIPEEVKKIADSAEMKVFTGLPENYNTIIPENFDHPAIVRELCKIIKSMKIKAEKIYIDACEPMVKAFLKTYPKIKITVIGWVNVVHKNIKKQNINAVDFLKTDTLYWQLF